jgi:hypothetical protein
MTETAWAPGLETLVTEDGEITEDGLGVMTLGLEILAQAAHRNARTKGWYEKDRQFPEEIALIHSEASEALEDYRDGRGMNDHVYAVRADENPGLDPNKAYLGQRSYDAWLETGVIAKPCGIPSELADIMIRVADIAGNPDRPVELGRAVSEKVRYNRTRPARHGGKLA